MKKALFVLFVPLLWISCKKDPEVVTVQNVSIQVQNDDTTYRLSAAPNPASNHFMAMLELPEPSSANLKVYNLSGVLMVDLQMQDVLPAGKHSFMIDCSQWPQGMYFLMWEHKRGKTVIKVLVSR